MHFLIPHSRGIKYQKGYLLRSEVILYSIKGPSIHKILRNIIYNDKKGGKINCARYNYLEFLSQYIDKMDI